LCQRWTARSSAASWFLGSFCVGPEKQTIRIKIQTCLTLQKTLPKTNDKWKLSL
jgi:hypothetical protein